MTQVTNATFDAEVLKSKEPVLVDFYTDTCPPCRMMAPLLAEIETEAAGSLKVVKINAAVRPLGFSYSKFMDAAKKKGIALDRKSLAHLAEFKPETFKKIVDLVR